ncbi:hypothetical protein HZS_2738 [Henneguya salminicola]|nr:hypothetical protein HZS_2738 [Henneguya salminicola]
MKRLNFELLLLLIITTLAVSAVISDPDPIDIPTVERAIAIISLTPSPTMATFFPYFVRSGIISI